MPDHLTAAETGKLLLVTGHRVSQLCAAGIVPGAYQQYGRWFLPTGWVKAEIKRREKAAGRRGIGRPTKLTQHVRAAAKKEERCDV